jgi:hypothetical protein
VAKPTWQTDTGCRGRAYNDLSADADPATGMQVYDSAQGGWEVVGGTSEATPLIAAYYALLGSAAQGPAWAYANAGLLNDPSSGSNGSCYSSFAYICQGATGYDGPTGAGSISGAVATGAPGIGGPGTNGSYTQSTTATTAQLQGGIYPNGSDTTYWWEYGTTTGYGQQTAGVDIGSGNAPVSVTDSLQALQPGTTYHYRLVAQNSLGTEYGYDFTLSTAGGAANGPAGTGVETINGTTGTGTTSTTPVSSSPPATTTAPVSTTPPVTTTPPSTGTTGTTGSTGASSGSGSSSAGDSVPPTTGPAPAKPSTSIPRIAAASANAATITAGVGTGGIGAQYAVQYGSTPSLGRSLAGALGGSATGVSATLRNLSPGAIYYARVVVTNAAGSATSATIRFRTSAVTIAAAYVRGGRIHAVLRCHGPAPCRVRLQVRSGSRVIAGGTATVRGNRTVTVNLSSGAARRVTFSVLSSWNGYPAAVTATA